VLEKSYTARATSSSLPMSLDKTVASLLVLKEEGWTALCEDLKDLVAACELLAAQTFFLLITAHIRVSKG
jgi:hypothetical protein